MSSSLHTFYDAVSFRSRENASIRVMSSSHFTSASCASQNAQDITPSSSSGENVTANDDAERVVTQTRACWLHTERGAGEDVRPRDGEVPDTGFTSIVASEPRPCHTPRELQKPQATLVAGPVHLLRQAEFET